MKIFSATTISLVEILASNVLASNDLSARTTNLRHGRKTIGLFGQADAGSDVQTADATKTNGNGNLASSVTGNGNGNGQKDTTTTAATTATTAATTTTTTKATNNGNGNNGNGQNGQVQTTTTTATTVTSTTTTSKNVSTTAAAGDTTTKMTTSSTTPFWTTTEAPITGGGNGGKGNGNGNGKGNGNGNGGGGNKGGTDGNGNGNGSGNGNGKNSHGYGFNEEDTSVFATPPADNGPFDINSFAYTFGDSVTITFGIPDLNALINDYNISNVESWPIGIYMRMSHPQWGANPPITSLLPDLTYEGSGITGSVTFSTDAVDQMVGYANPLWPLDLLEYGNGYDVWLLDESGHEVMGPSMFAVDFTQAMKDEISAEEQKKPNHGLMKFSKGSSKNKNYGKGKDNGGKGGVGSGGTGKGSGKNGGMILGTGTVALASYELTTDKYNYLTTDPVSVDFSIATSQPKWKIGIFMRMAHPQGGELEPIVSIPLCGKASCAGPTLEGSVQFSTANDAMTGSWPLDVGKYGNGFDVWILDHKGAEIAGPVMFVVDDESETS